MDCSPPGASVHGILLARILEWVASSSSRWSSWARDQNSISCKSPALQADSLPLSHWGSPNTLKDWIINDKHSELFTSTYRPPWSHRLLLSSITTSEDKTPRSIKSKVVAVSTCRVRNGALGQKQKLLERWPWCFLDLHSLENHGKKNSVFEREHNQNYLVS